MINILKKAKKQKHIAYITAFCLLISPLAFTSNGYADQSIGSLEENNSDVWNTLEDIDWLMKLADKDLAAERQKAADYLKELDELENTLNMTAEEKARLEAEYIGLSGALSETEEQYMLKYAQSAERLNTAYQYRSAGISTVLAGCEDLMSVMRLICYGTSVSESDDELLHELNDLKSELMLKQSLVYEDRLAAALKLAGEQADADTLRKALSESEESIRSIESVYMELERREDELLEESKRLEEQIRVLQAEEKARREAAKAKEAAEAASRASTAKSNKALDIPTEPANTVGETSASSWIWPAPGYTQISSPFGGRIHPIYKVWKIHQGIDINAPYGASIKAAKTGVVIMSGWSSGYGNCVIIDHGDGISTLYAHASSLLVKTGERVAQGDDIAIVGSTGLSTGAHLHFEVRLNGVPVDPMNYVGG